MINFIAYFITNNQITLLLEYPLNVSNIIQYTFYISNEPDIRFVILPLRTKTNPFRSRDFWSFLSLAFFLSIPFVKKIQSNKRKRNQFSLFILKQKSRKKGEKKE